jgi:hypothetical protein
MRPLNPKQRDVLSNKLADLGNIAIGSLVFGFVVRTDAFNGLSLVLGICIAVMAYIFAIKLEENKNKTDD